jgi:hypothetical protein
MRGSSPVLSISGSRLSSIGRVVLAVGAFMWISSQVEFVSMVNRAS